MEITEASEGDIPEIVSLLKLSLGESLMPKSEQYWRWKHLENPFGTSPVLLCRQGGELIGVRAFMRWQWSLNDQIYSTVRAVDTATHPNYQGKGIFKKLTLSLIEYCKQRGDDFIYNTPNQQSRPGYLKMGWEDVGKLPVRISVQRPFSIVKNFIKRNHSQADFGPLEIAHYLQHPGLDSLLKGYQHKDCITTRVSKQYLNWRYFDVPVVNYVAIGEELGNELTGLIIGRIKDTRIGRELRVTDWFFNHEISVKELIRKLGYWKRTAHVDYTTISGIDKKAKKVLPGFSFTASVGPMVTIRALRITDLDMLKNFNRWSPSLGDLELF